jgi:negative regulator of replication initiation
MKTIEIDDEVFAFLQGQAIPFLEDPNKTIRRLLGIKAQQKIQRRPERKSRGKNPKADLRKLIAAHLIQDGQRLHLRDYQGRKVADAQATVSQALLLHKGKRMSMSSLAKVLLQEQGYESEAVRGPAFWFTENGSSIKDLWEQYLDSQA